MGYSKVGTTNIYSAEDKTPNISFLISIFDDGFIHAQSKDRGTKSFHMMPFFQSMVNYLKNERNLDQTKVVHILDNFRGSKCIDFYQKIKELKCKVLFLPG